jgi:hypothetical protein
MRGPRVGGAESPQSGEPRAGGPLGRPDDADITYTLTLLRYDLRKMKAHALIERIGRGYRYRLTDKRTKAALMFIVFHKRVCGPLATSLFHNRSDEILKPASKVETAYHAIQQVLDLFWRVKTLRDEFSKWLC